MEDAEVAGYAGGSLPPPLARAVLKALDRYEWLRERAGETMAEGDGDLHEASSAYLGRPQGWSSTVLRLSEEAVRRMGIKGGASTGLSRCGAIVAESPSQSTGEP